jgi:hypothetical protein
MEHHREETSRQTLPSLLTAYGLTVGSTALVCWLLPWARKKEQR